MIELIGYFALLCLLLFVVVEAHHPARRKKGDKR